MSKNDIEKKISIFFRTAFKYYGKEIGLTSNQPFFINQLCNPEKEQYGEYNYMIQYGFPQSGCVSLKFQYSQEEKSFTINEVSVYAPPAEENIIMANFATPLQDGPIGVDINFGMDMGTKSHTSIDEIEENPNALKMIELATSDLSKAQILGKCMLEVPEGSDMIPCCNSVHIFNNKGRTKI